MRIDPEKEQLIAFMSILYAHLMIILISVPLMRRQIKRNSVYGMRTRATLADDEVWFEANARAGRHMVVFGILSGLAAVALYAVRATRDWFVEGTIAILLVGLLSIVWVNVRYANKLLEEKEFREGRRLSQ